jgi:hypothetical protein
MEDKQEDFDYDRYFRSYREIDNYIENYIAMSSINIKNIKEEEIEAMGMAYRRIRITNNI